MKNQRARKNINFKQTKSERSATASYRNFGSYIKNISNYIKGRRVARSAKSGLN